METYACIYLVRYVASILRSHPVPISYARISILNTHSQWQWAVHMLIYWTCWNVINVENYCSRHIFGHVAQSTLIYGIFPVHLQCYSRHSDIHRILLLLMHFSRAFNPHNKQLSFVYANTHYAQTTLLKIYYEKKNNNRKKRTHSLTHAETPENKQKNTHSEYFGCHSIWCFDLFIAVILRKHVCF